MMFAASLLTTVLLALTATAAVPPVLVNKPLISLPITKRYNFTGTSKIIESDLSRAKAFRDRAEARRIGSSFSSDADSVSITNTAVTYVASVGVGSPATIYDLLIDTGSSNTWVGADKIYKRTPTSQQTGDEVGVVYGSGSFAGLEFLDMVTLAPSLAIVNQSIGIALVSQGFNELKVDGILGIGPVGLTKYTIIGKPNIQIPTVTDNLFSQGTIPANLVSVSYEPTTEPDVTIGELIFGGIDRSKITGPLNFVPITSTYPASDYWGISQSIQYGNSTTILNETTGIVDTGTTLIVLASDGYQAYMAATGAIQDPSTGLLRVTPTQFANLESMFFDISGTVYEFTANAQAWPRTLNAAIGGTPNYVYLIVGNLETPGGQGLDFINGFAFLERFYSVYDTGNQQVGFATTAFTYATTN